MLGSGMCLSWLRVRTDEHLSRHQIILEIKFLNQICGTIIHLKLWARFIRGSLHAVNFE
jgi:hypothetical protein